MKSYFRTFGVTTVTTYFEADLLGRVAGIARACGVDCCIATRMVDDIQEITPMLSVCLTGTEDSVNEVIYRLWETLEISEAA